MVNSVSPPLSALRTFGCACYSYLRPYNKHKLQPRFVECVFLGYPLLSKGYLCLDPTTNKIYINCYVLFNESVFPFSDRSDLIASNVPFSSPISDSTWFSINSNVSSPSSAAPSFSPSPLSSFPDSFHLALLQSDSCNSDSHFSSSSIPSFVPALPLSVSSKSSSSILVNNHPMVTRSKLGIHKPKFLKVGTNYTF